MLGKLEKTSEDVIADYFNLLFTHTKTRLKSKYGYQEGSALDLVVTIPAIWNLKAREIMVRAAQRAARASSFGAEKEIFLVSEPEAAATYVSETKRDLIREVSRDTL